MTWTRPRNEDLPADGRTVRIAPDALDLMLGRRHVLASVLPSGRPTSPRHSSQPSPAKARAYARARFWARLRNTASEMATDLLFVAPLAVLAAIGWIAYLALC